MLEKIDIVWDKVGGQSGNFGRMTVTDDMPFVLNNFRYESHGSPGRYNALHYA